MLSQFQPAKKLAIQLEILCVQCGATVFAGLQTVCPSCNRPACCEGCLHAHEGRCVDSRIIATASTLLRQDQAPNVTFSGSCRTLHTLQSQTIAVRLANAGRIPAPSQELPQVQYVLL